jgi:integrase
MITKHRTGSLLKRGSNYYVRAMIEGKAITKALRDDNGNPITTIREAELARERFMAPFAVATKAEALQTIAGKLSDSQAQIAKWEDEQNPPLPISQAWSEFLASPNRPDSGKETLYQYECQWSRFADWMKEKHPDLLMLRAVGKSIAEDYAASLNHGTLAPGTFNKHLNLLTLVFRVVKSKARLTENPWEEIQRKRLITHSRRELTVDELRSVCQSANGEMRVLLAIGIYCGLRLGDAATLRWCEVDLSRGLIRRIPNKISRSANPKTVQIPIHPVLREMLAETPTAERGEYVLPGLAASYQHRTDAVTDLVQAHFKVCGIKVWKSGTGPGSKDGKRAVIEVGFHSLRHSFVSLCRESDVPLAVVESLVGHSNPAMTRHYSHIGQLAATRAIAALPVMTGEDKPAEIKPSPETILSKAKGIVEGITENNWRKQKAALLALLA